MRPHVLLRSPDGRLVELGHGDLIGRLSSAALCVDDVRVSEAHAMVSLRGSELKLLALRGRFTVDLAPATEAVLEPGQLIHLARDLAIEVDDVVLPEQVLAIEGDGLPRQTLPATASLYVHPVPRLVPRYEGDADAHLWTTGDQWRLRSAEAGTRGLAPGDTWTLGGRTFRAVHMELRVAGANATRAQGAIHRPLRLVARFDTVHLQLEGEAEVVLGGLAARILSELVAFAGPADWEVLAREVWPDEADRISLRRRWDMGLVRLRRKLEELQVRPDLVFSDGQGHVELLLREGDRVEDQT
jgi:hypothetical protein